MDPTFVITVRPRVRPSRGKVHITPGGARGLTLCNIPCDGWVVTDANPTCKRCVVADELNRMPGVPDGRSEVHADGDGEAPDADDA